jgi:hypothetical protein
VKALRAGGLLFATVIGLIWASAGLAQEATTEPTTTDETTTTTTTESTAEAAPDPWAETPRTRDLRRRALWLKLVARKLSRLTQHERPRIDRTRAEFASLFRYRLWLRDAWRIRAERARYRAHHPPHLGGWRCIHRFEGSWTDPNSPYYGGLQMDLAFQRAYGPGLLRRKGTADHWAPHEQMWIAERALRAGRGFYPWPLTARRCGLI